MAPIAKRLIEIPSLDALHKHFRRQKISTETWGVEGPTKAPEQLFGEHTGGESGFVMRQKRLIRLTRRSKAVIGYLDLNGTLERLREVECTYATGHVEPGSKGPAVSEKAHWLQGREIAPETPLQTLLRGLKEEVNLLPCQLLVVEPKYRKTSYRDSTRAYPGLPTESVDETFLVLVNTEGRCRARLREELPHRITTWEWNAAKRPWLEPEY